MSNVLITGASSGIGKALANEYASRGRNLVLLARRGELLMSLKREIESEYRVRVMALAADVTDDASLNAAVQEARKELGSLDTVIANAGFGVHGCAEDLSLKDFERQFDVNVFGVLRTFYATLADLKATRGRFCIIGSGCAYVTSPDSVAYSMSKHAVRSLAEGLYVELARHGVSVTLINPGFIDTDIRRTSNEGVVSPNAADPVPRWLMMDSATAARKIRRAVDARRRERAITAHGQIVIWIARFFPGLLLGALKLASRRSPRT